MAPQSRIVKNIRFQNIFHVNAYMQANIQGNEWNELLLYGCSTQQNLLYWLQACATLKERSHTLIAWKYFQFWSVFVGQLL